MSKKYTTVFWFCYVTSMVWVIAILLSFALFAYSNINFYETHSLNEYLSLKLSYRRMAAVLIGVTTINWMLFMNKKHLDKVFMFLVAWMWASYIDDQLVMIKYFFVPDHWLPRLAVTMRPITLLMISWMAFEAHLRAETNDE